MSILVLDKIKVVSGTSDPRMDVRPPPDGPLFKNVCNATAFTQNIQPTDRDESNIKARGSALLHYRFLYWGGGKTSDLKELCSF